MKLNRFGREAVAADVEIADGPPGLPGDGQPDRGAGRAAHLLDRLGDGEPPRRFAVDRHDHVAGPDARLLGRRAGDHPLDSRPLAARDDRDPDIADLALAQRPQGEIGFAAHVAGMGVERGDHRYQRRLDQLGFVRLLDISAADEFENRAEAAELTVGVVQVRPGAPFETAMKASAAPAARPAAPKATRPR